MKLIKYLSVRCSGKCCSTTIQYWRVSKENCATTTMWTYLACMVTKHGDASSQCTLKVRQTMDTTTVRFAFNTKWLLVHEICPRQQARIQFVENGTKTNTTAKQAYFLLHIEWYYVFTFTWVCVLVFLLFFFIFKCSYFELTCLQMELTFSFDHKINIFVDLLSSTLTAYWIVFT